MTDKDQRLILWFDQIDNADVALVGGKNASLGEMYSRLTSRGIRVPNGFAVTALAYQKFIENNRLTEFIDQTLKDLDTGNLAALQKCGAAIRNAIAAAELPGDLIEQLGQAYRDLSNAYHLSEADVAVRSSATAEDLPGASFAGEHETYLNVVGEEMLVKAVKLAMASLFNDRAISYRVDKGFEHSKVALSVGVQKMVRADQGVSGVMFTVDTESGFRDVVLINSVWGLGEMIVQGRVTPDEFLVFKPSLAAGSPRPIIDKVLGDKRQKMVYASNHVARVKATKIVATSARERAEFALTDEEVLELARWGVEIEKHYSERHQTWTPMDMEWAKDGESGQLFIVQARPETVQARRDFSKFTEYSRTGEREILARGISVGSKIISGRAHIILDAKHINQFQAGEVLVTDMTDPDWEPIMKIAAAIVTDKGGRTSHAAIVSRELGIPAIVGTGNATRVIKTGDEMTVDTTGSEGLIYAGRLPFTVKEYDIGDLPATRTKVMINIATPEIAFEKSFLPVVGVGLAREEFVIASRIGIHPLALINYDELKPVVRRQIDRRTTGWLDKKQFYVDNLAFGIARIAAAFYPRPVIVRFSDFKTNEYRSLLGGATYEPTEENPMLGWRGASRYYDPNFAPAFALECQALKKARQEMGLTNIIPMIPFCRTVEEARKTLKIMAQNGLTRPQVPVYVMCEIPANVLLADQFLDLFDGMSIGSNDLTQLTLGLDRDSNLVSHVSNEDDLAVRKLIEEVIETCQRRGKYIGICGQGPSDLSNFVQFLIERGIESVSLNPDTVIKTIKLIADYENSILRN